MNWMALFLAVTGFGFWGFFLALATKHMTPMAIQLSYSLINLVFTTLASVTLGLPIKGNLPGLGWITLTAFVGVIGGMFNVMAIQGSSNPGLVNVMVHACPLITLMLMIIFLHERVTFQAGLGVFFVIMGLVLISFKH